MPGLRPLIKVLAPQIKKAISSGNVAKIKRIFGLIEKKAAPSELAVIRKRYLEALNQAKNRFPARRNPAEGGVPVARGRTAERASKEAGKRATEEASKATELAATKGAAAEGAAAREAVVNPAEGGVPNTERGLGNVKYTGSNPPPGVNGNFARESVGARAEGVRLRSASNKNLPVVYEGELAAELAVELAAAKRGRWAALLDKKKALADKWKNMPNKKKRLAYVAGLAAAGGLGYALKDDNEDELELALADNELLASSLAAEQAARLSDAEAAAALIQELQRQIAIANELARQATLPDTQVVTTPVPAIDNEVILRLDALDARLNQALAAKDAEIEDEGEEFDPELEELNRLRREYYKQSRRHRPMKRRRLKKKIERILDRRHEEDSWQNI